MRVTLTAEQVALLAKKGVPLSVTSPDGLVPISRVINMGEKSSLRINGQVFSKDHLFENENSEWVTARSLVEGDVLLGGIPVTSIEDAGINTVFDLTVEHSNHRYYAAGLSSHNCSDGMNTWALMEYFSGLADTPFKVQPVPVMVDHKMSDVLRAMYRTGAPIDAEYYFYAALDAIHYIDKLQVAIDELAGHRVEINSPAQLSDLLFKEFKLPVLEGMELNKQGNYSTAEEVLDDLFDKYPDFTILKYVVLYRKLNNQLAKFYGKALSNAFVDDFQPYLRVQYSFSQTNVPTGRLSSNSGDGRDRVSVKENKTSLGLNFKKGSWDCGFNSQGVTNSSFRKTKAKKIKALPPEAGYNLKDLYSQEERETLIKTVAKF